MERRNRKQFMYSLRPGSCKVFGKIVFTEGGDPPTSPEANFPGVDAVAEINPAAKTGQYRIQFSDKYLDLVGFSASTMGAADGDGYDIMLTEEWVQGSTESGAADAYQDGYVNIQFMQGGTARNPGGAITAYLEFTMKTSEQG